MSDEIVDVDAQYVPDEIKTEKGMNIPDSAFVEEFVDEMDERDLKQIEERRQEISNLPEYPSEWQEDYKDEDTKGFDENLKLPVTATIKQAEINKLIKKYKRYMSSNIREIRRVENDV